MAELSEEQKKAMEEQKAQCPFCQIISGKIPAKKIYEDDKVVAILDINPASKGHALVMPKEHYPIMPLIPKDVFAHLFKIVRDISKSLKKSLLMQGTNVFIANGGVAGQQSGHFMIHIIPREEGDGFSGIKLKPGKVDETKVNELEKMLKHNLPLMLRDFYAKHPIEGKEVNTAASPKPTKEQIISLIEKNPQLLELLKTNPEAVKKSIPSNEQLKALFSVVDFDEIVAHFNPGKKGDGDDDSGNNNILELDLSKIPLGQEDKNESKDENRSKDEDKEKDITEVNHKKETQNKEKESEQNLEDSLNDKKRNKNSSTNKEDSNREDNSNNENHDNSEDEENNDSSSEDEEDNDTSSEDEEDNGSNNDNNSDDKENHNEENDNNSDSSSSLDDIARLFA